LEGWMAGLSEEEIQRECENTNSEQMRRLCIKRQTEELMALRNRLNLPEAIIPWPLPGSSLGSPIAYTAEWGTIFLGGSYVFASSQLDDDGTPFIGFGMGDSQKYIAVELVASIYNVFADGGQGGFSLNEGGISFQAGHEFPQFAIAVGRENFYDWGANRGFVSNYLVLTKYFELRENENGFLSSMTASVGIGDGRFRSADDLVNDRDKVGVFGSLSFRVFAPASLIIDWKGNDLNIGASVIPYKELPLALSFGVINVLEKLPSLSLSGNVQDEGRRVLFAVSYSVYFI